MLFRSQNRKLQFTLLTVGPKFSDVEIEKYKLRQLGKNWEHFSGADENLLNKLFFESDIYVMTSKMEGFGMPILEALSQGTRVVASEIPVFLEIGEKYISYFDPESAEDLMEKLLSIFDQGDTLESVKGRILFAKKSTWFNTAKNMAEVYKGIDR